MSIKLVRVLKKKVQREGVFRELSGEQETVDLVEVITHQRVVGQFDCGEGFPRYRFINLLHTETKAYLRNAAVRRRF
jgi:hypothetical protein